jgi:hypothetical protein
VKLRETLGIALILVSTSVGAAEITEYELKAEFLERFTRFIDWPDTPQSEKRPFMIGIVGTDPFGPHLEDLARRRTIKDRRIVVRYLDREDDLLSCDVLFVAGSEQKAIGEIVRRTSGRPILTVGDTSGYAEAGILINFIVEDNHIHFEINEQAARRSGLEIRAKLFKLARLVEAEN